MGWIDRYWIEDNERQGILFDVLFPSSSTQEMQIYLVDGSLKGNMLPHAASETVI